MFDAFKTAAEFKESCGYSFDDNWYPRVTRIVSIKAKPALYRYYGRAASFAAAQNTTEKSAQEGTLLHAAAEAILLGEEPQVAPLIQPAISAFREFLAKTDIRVAAGQVEMRIKSDTHRYAGTIDALAEIDGRLGVLDIKTSSAVYRDYNLQTAAYMEALKDLHLRLETRWILRIDQHRACERCGAILRVKGGQPTIRKAGHFLCHPREHAWQDLEGAVELHEFPV